MQPDEDEEDEEDEEMEKTKRRKKGGEKKKKKKGLWKPLPWLNPNTGKYSTNYSEFCEPRFRHPTQEYAERASKMSHSRISNIVNAAREYMGKRSPGEHIGFDKVEVHGQNELADDEDNNNDDDDH